MIGNISLRKPDKKLLYDRILILCLEPQPPFTIHHSRSFWAKCASNEKVGTRSYSADNHLLTKTEKKKQNIEKHMIQFRFNLVWFHFHLNWNSALCAINKYKISFFAVSGCNVSYVWGSKSKGTVHTVDGLRA